MRVVSFLPSATEIVFALGAGEQLVGRSHECDFPAEVRGLPIVMRAKELDASLSSAEIDRRVQARMARHEALYEIDEAVLTRLQPDLLLTQDLCRVCSVTPEELSATLARTAQGARMLTLSPTRLPEVLSSIGEVARALGLPDRGKALEADLARRLEAASPERSSKGTAAASGSKPRVGVLEWLDPPILAGLWTPDMIRRAGGLPVLVRPGETSHRTTWDELRGAAFDLLVVSPCAFPLDRTLGELRGRQVHPLEDLHPARGIWAADEAFFSRPGPRVVEGVELLADLLHGPGRPRRPFEGRAVPAFRSPLPAYRIPTRR